MSEVTFSSNVLVNDSEVAEERFSAITLTLADGQALEQFHDEQETLYTLSFAGRGLREAHTALKAVEARNLMNGQPRATLGNYFDAVCRGQGELVTLTISLYNPGEADDAETVTKVGVITNLVWSAARGPLAQRLDLVFHVCHRLHVRSGGTVTTLTDPDAA